MTTETILTDDQIDHIIEGVAWPNEEVFNFGREVGRAIEQAVLQSPEIQAMREDALRYRWIRLQRTITDHACVTWNIGHDWVQMDGAELDAAIDHARRAEGDGE